MSRRWQRAAAGGVVLIVAWLGVGLLPRVVQTEMWGVDPESITEDIPEQERDGGASESSVVTDPSDGFYDGFWIFQNKGVLPITVRGGPFSESVLDEKIAVVELNQKTYEDVATRETVSVGPGRYFGVRYGLAFGCATMAGGTATGKDSIPVSVTTLGLTRTVDVKLPGEIWVGTSVRYKPPESCE